MANRSSSQRDAVSARLLKARTLVSTSLVQAMAATRTSHAAAARSMGVTTKTISRWVHLVAPVNVERVLASPRLGTVFRTELCTFEHGHDGLPYVVRKAARVRGKK